MTVPKLEMLRWGCAALCAAIVFAELSNPGLRKGGTGVLLFFAFLIAGVPASLISLHLHGAKWFGTDKGPKK